MFYCVFCTVAICTLWKIKLVHYLALNLDGFKSIKTNNRYGSSYNIYKLLLRQTNYHFTTNLSSYVYLVANTSNLS